MVIVDANSVDDDDPFWVIARTVGMYGLGIYELIKLNARNGRANTISGIANQGRSSVQRVRKVCRVLAENGWIRVNGNIDDLSSPAKRDRSQDVGCVYILEAGGRHKIGVARNVAQRLEQLNGSQSPYPITEIHHVETLNPYGLESELHERWGAHRIRGEWFQLSPGEVKVVIKQMDEWGDA